MSAERNGDRAETIKADAFAPGQSDEAPALIELYRKTAGRLLRDDAPNRAFTELVRATRLAPMTARLASALVRVALRAGTEAQAVVLLSDGLQAAEGPERAFLRRPLIRLLRRTGQRERARKLLDDALAENPADASARRLLNALLAADERWEDLDASLDEEVNECLERKAFESASRASLRRARLWRERLANPAQSALHLGRAAQYAREGAAHPPPLAEDYRKLEAQYVARQAWDELAGYYRERSQAAADPAERAELLARLAELLEDELHDGAAAAKVYGELVQATGDRRALAEEVRLLSSRSDLPGVRREFDAAVEGASDPSARAEALVSRGEAALARGDLRAARADLRAALELIPAHLRAHAALSELAPRDPTVVLAFHQALASTPCYQPGRSEGYRKLARLAESLGDSPLAEQAWCEVLADQPADAQAQAALATLSRTNGNPERLVRLLRAQLEREPRGPAARSARLELVSVLEQDGKLPEALAELRQAVRFEPGHKEAWLALSERLAERGQNVEAAWSLEQAASATEDQGERVETWRRLARFARVILKDESRAATYSARAEMLSAPQLAPSPPPPGADEDWEGSTVGALGSGSPPQISGGASPTDEMPAQPDPYPALPPLLIPPLPTQRLAHDRDRLLQQLRDRPLDPESYRLLADSFEEEGDDTRAGLLTEIVNALEGESHPPPGPPRLICSSTDRAGLRHPALRGKSGELLSQAGMALCQLFPARGRAAGSKEEFRLDSGRGSQSAAEALLAAVRILGLRAPEIFLSEDNGPPFALVYAGAARILVGKLAVKKQLPEAELRFFAGRALFSQNPDLLVLRSLSGEQLSHALEVLGGALGVGGTPGAEARGLKQMLPSKGLARLKELFDHRAQAIDLPALAEGARHSANRAGLIVCGGVAPALAALKAKKALESEIIELVRFSASERYLELRSRTLGPG